MLVGGTWEAEVGMPREMPKVTNNADIQLLNKEEDMMKEAYAQSIECEEPCEGRLSRTVL